MTGAAGVREASLRTLPWRAPSGTLSVVMVVALSDAEKLFSRFNDFD